MWVLRFAALAVVATLPGVGLGFTLLERDTPLRIKWAFTLALSPAVVALAIVLFAIAGVPFGVAAWAVAGLSLLALPLLLPRRHHRPKAAATTGAASAPIAISFFLIGGLLCAVWGSIPGLRAYGWHNLLQVAAAYQISSLPLLPEEADLAGLPLNYPWLGLTQLTVMAWLADTPPTAVFIVINLLQLFALLTLIVETSRYLAAAGRQPSGWITIAILLGTNLLGTIAFLFDGPQTLHGEGRIGPFVAKYLFIDAMVIGLSLVAALVFLVTMTTVRRVARLWLIVPALLVATAVSYPLLMPSALAVAGILWLMLIVIQQRRLAGPAYSRNELLAMLLGIAVSVGAAALYVGVLGGSSRGVHAVGMSSFLANVTTGGPVIAVLVLLAWPELRRAWAARTTPGVTLILCAAGSTVLYLALQMPVDVQYKSLFTATLCLAPLVVATLTSWLHDSGGMQRVLVIGFLIVMTGTGAVSLWTRQKPYNLDGAMALDESSFRLTERRQPALDWLDALRTRTPHATWLITPDSAVPVSVLTGRMSVIAADLPQPLTRLGYSMTTSTILGEMTALPQDVYTQRTALRASVYAPDGDFASVTRDLAALSHPIAIVFDAPGRAAYLDWLRAHREGQEVPSASTVVIWLLFAS